MMQLQLKRTTTISGKLTFASSWSISRSLGPTFELFYSDMAPLLLPQDILLSIEIIAELLITARVLKFLIGQDSHTLYDTSTETI